MDKINLDIETSDIRIETISYNVNVYTDDIPNPMVIVKGDATIENDWCIGWENKYAKIKENVENTTTTKRIFKKGFFSNVFCVSKTIVISKNGKVTVNGYPISGEDIGCLEAGSIDLVIPNGKDIVKHIEIESMSGSIRAKDLNIGKGTSPTGFTAKTMSGSITLERFHATSTKLSTLSGNISAEIYESKRNYETNSTNIL